jgi:oligopeptide transport system ATP-binding protein
VNGAPLLTVRTSRSISGSAAACSPRNAGVLKAVDGVSFDLKPGETWAWSANPAAASRRSAAPCCACCPIHVEGRVVWLGEDLAKLGREAMRGAGARCRSSSRTRWPALNPRMTVGEIIGEPLHTFQPEPAAAEANPPRSRP